MAPEGAGRPAVTIAALVIALAAAAILVYLVTGGRPDSVADGDPAASATRDGASELAAPSSDAPAPEVVFVGAGDIASCSSDGDEATAAILDEVVAEHPDAVVFTAGDNAYPDGSYEDFTECYEPSWGRHRDRTRPAVGNHEFGQGQAAGHHRYFGDAAGPTDRSYYSYDLDGWHVVVLSSMCGHVGCELDAEGGDQAEWLVQDLEASEAECTMAIWHHPRWSSGRYGNDPDYATFWFVLYDHGAEIVLNGHDHVYERFEPMAPDGSLDPDRGIRQFTVGTGGAGLRGFEEIAANSAARGSDPGVLDLRLAEGSYRWEFLAVEGASFTDTGSGSCH